MQPEVAFDCVAIEDTAIDKISSLLWRIGIDEYDPTEIRHMYDLAMLYGKITIDEKFKNILNMVYSRDMAIRAKSERTLKQSIDIIIAAFSKNGRYARDYENYVSGMSYARDSENLSFDQARDRFVALVKKLI